MLWAKNIRYQVEPYAKETDLEAAILEVSEDLFGPQRIYLDVKKKIGSAGKTNSIPDGYLIDLTSSRKPTLYVVENELSRHDPLRHVAVQLLQFSLAFDASKPKVKAVLQTALSCSPTASQQCSEYAQQNGFANVDYLLHWMINEGDFGALVIIDELSYELEVLLAQKLRFPVEVITLNRYCSSAGERVYAFEPFLSDVVPVTASTLAGISASWKPLDTSEIDTIVVPAQEEGFTGTFIEENRWYKIRIHAAMIPKIKHIAAYRTAPVSAITHIAEVHSIEPWQNSDKYIVNFVGDAQPIGPIKLRPNGTVKAPQNIRYTSHERLIGAKTLDDAF